MCGGGSSTYAEAGRDSAGSLFNTQQQLEGEGEGAKEEPASTDETVDHVLRATVRAGHSAQEGAVIPGAKDFPGAKPGSARAQEGRSGWNPMQAGVGPVGRKLRESPN